ncbi:MAG: biofilm PGA synthesis N-glycosyltransferase PgaC [Patescibacteria group bacterium]|jgi:biofilm PGA synthesis N-glycosyltransferase PgaC
MDFLTVVYLSFTFIALYFNLIYFFTYFQNRSQIFEVIKPNRDYSLSIVIPCYNEADSIGETIETLLRSDYTGLKKIIVVDDCSTDNSYTIIKKYAKLHARVMAVQTPENTGRAAGAKNYGASFAESELIGFSDADSFSDRDAITKMVGFFNDQKVGAVTSRVLVRNRKNYLEKAQGIEYKVIAFTRKLLGFIEAIYVTNGPLSIYRKLAFDSVNGFDEVNLTEDIEITWHFVSKGWKIHMAMASKVYTVVPNTLKAWFAQRVRWNVGGIQTIVKYRKTFLKVGMLGIFILPFFVFGWLIGIVGLGFLVYRAIKVLSVKLLTYQYSYAAEVTVVSLTDISLTPNIMWYFGAILFVLGAAYTLIGLMYSKEDDRRNIFLSDILIYTFFYLLMYPPLLIYSGYKFLRGYDSW